ncbi:hypothetical protein HPB48_017827 [Haemaphysalis longicornis]|uniref:C2H2-type domain-containing protein n=1 Tax=Haemaphysalis longicornis TaxID=44386 RepID=A0A9J6GCJ5_HAELO|nr:hypothetical protein HPB48_017827 [Haemaphysalis longicornis]
MYRCRSCPYTTNNKVHMETHVRKHTGERPFACAQCGRRFSDRCNMRRHERKHADPFAAEGMAAAEGMTAAFACGLCPKTFPASQGPLQPHPHAQPRAQGHRWMADAAPMMWEGIINATALVYSSCGPSPLQPVICNSSMH